MVKLGVRPPLELVDSTGFLLKRLGWAIKDRTFAAFEEVGESPYHYGVLAVLEESARETQAIDLNFGLLSDWNAEAVHAFGIAFEHRGLKDVAQRTTFLVGGDGVIRNGWQYETGEVPDIEEWLAAARELQTSDASGS